MNIRILIALGVLLAALDVLTGASIAVPGAAEPLRVCATTPDLGSLVSQIGADDVTVTVFTKGTEDPHFLEAKPSFVKAASQADLFIQAGLELEIGWAPAILLNSRNERIQPGAPGFLDASTAITPLEVPTGQVDRSMGDVHSGGNPHYLTDPICGLQVARLIAARLGELRPEQKAAFDQRFKSFRDKLGAALVGQALAAKYDVEKLALLAEHDRLVPFLKAQGDDGALAGWLGALAPHSGIKAVADHNLWPYFARRYGLAIVGFLEPKPGISPTTKHLGQLIESMKREGVRLILTAPYFDPRHAAFVSRETGAAIVELAHQVGSRPGADDYLSTCDYNVRALAGALKGTQ
jgi:ABC-type Zn uptake system ZnuABC Zn-binding protein ZnuA